MLKGKPKVIKDRIPASVKKYSIVISLNEADYQQASIEAKKTKQTIAAWIADMVYTSTQP